MLKKLLRYDLKSVFKYWWIAAVASLGVAILGGASISVLNTERKIPVLLSIGAGLGIFVAILGLSAFIITSTILIFVRFYKNFFTDEGYLTFTLPVRRSQLINSKLLMSLITNVATFAVFIVDIFILVLIGTGVNLSTVFTAIGDLLAMVDFKTGIYIFVFLIEFTLAAILSFIISTLFLFCCITFASIISKKAKVLTAIGIYYVANSIFSGILQYTYIFSLTALTESFKNIPVNAFMPLIMIIALIALAALTLIGLLLYLLMYWMLDRKLNLA